MPQDQTQDSPYKRGAGAALQMRPWTQQKFEVYTVDMGSRWASVWPSSLRLGSSSCTCGWGILQSQFWILFPVTPPEKRLILSIIEDQPCSAQDSVLPQQAPEINSNILLDFREEHERALISYPSSPEGTIYSSLPWKSWRNFSLLCWWKKWLCLIEADRKNMRSFGHKWKTCLVF